MSRKKLAGFICLGIAVQFIIGGVYHFVYGILGGNSLVGLIAPANESIFEHIKLVPVPWLVWWSFIYYLKKNEVDVNRWYTACLASILCGVLFVPFFYYFYSGALGIKSMIADILNLLAASAVSQLFALHVYNRSSGIAKKRALLYILLLIVLLALLTALSPRLPIFYDELNGIYGMK